MLKKIKSYAAASVAVLSMGLVASEEAVAADSNPSIVDNFLGSITNPNVRTPSKSAVLYSGNNMVLIPTSCGPQAVKVVNTNTGGQWKTIFSNVVVTTDQHAVGYNGNFKTAKADSEPVPGTIVLEYDNGAINSDWISNGVINANSQNVGLVFNNNSSCQSTGSKSETPPTTTEPPAQCTTGCNGQPSEPVAPIEQPNGPGNNPTPNPGPDGGGFGPV